MAVNEPLRRGHIFGLLDLQPSWSCSEPRLFSGPVPHMKDFHAAILRMQAIVDVKWCVKKSPYTGTRQHCRHQRELSKQVNVVQKSADEVLSGIGYRSHDHAVSASRPANAAFV